MHTLVCIRKRVRGDSFKRIHLSNDSRSKVLVLFLIGPLMYFIICHRWGAENLKSKYAGTYVIA